MVMRKKSHGNKTSPRKSIQLLMIGSSSHYLQSYKVLYIPGGDHRISSIITRIKTRNQIQSTLTTHPSDSSDVRMVFWESPLEHCPFSQYLFLTKPSPTRQYIVMTPKFNMRFCCVDTKLMIRNPPLEQRSKPLADIPFYSLV